jgi:hypothetical protein
MNDSTKCPLRIAAGLLGAKALNGDKEKKSKAARKAAQTRKALNPDCFRKMGALSGIARKNRYKIEKVMK